MTALTPSSGPPTWQTLEQSYWKATVSPGGAGPVLPIDPYLVWAEATGFDLLAPGHQGNAPILTLVELRPGVKAEALKGVCGSEIDISPLWTKGLPRLLGDTRVPFCVVGFKTLSDLVGAIRKQAFRDLVSRFVVGEAVKAFSEHKGASGIDPTGGREKVGALLGVVDDGCAFAHQALRGPRNRMYLKAIWDQDERAPAFRTWVDSSDGWKGAPDRWTSYVPAQAPNYGQVAWFHQLVWLTNQHALPDRPLPSGRVPAAAPTIRISGPIDEEACYLDAKYPSALRAVSHGMHVLGLAAGIVPFGGFGERPPADLLRARARPSSMPDIVFVQIPREGIADASGAWLPTHLVDAVRFILECATETTTRTVVNISYGPQCGPLDGTSPLEEALAALVRAYGKPFDESRRKSAQPPAKGSDLPGVPPNPLPMSLDIVLPSGNFHRARGRAHLTVEAGHAGRLRLRVPSDNPRPTFVECWLDRRLADHVDVEIEGPGLARTMRLKTDATWCPLMSGRPDPLTCTVVYAKEVARGRNGAMVLLAIGPTANDRGQPTAPAGDWSIRFVNDGKRAVAIDAFVGRGDANHGAHARPRQAYLLDPDYDPERYLRPADQDPGSAVVTRKGTISGITSGDAVQVVGGYRLRDLEPAVYTSSGPARAAPPPPATQIVGWSAPTDQSAVLPGIVGLSNRSGGTARFIGTSAAAPQIAAYILKRRGGQQSPPAPQEWEKNTDQEERLSKRRLSVPRKP